MNITTQSFLNMIESLSIPYYNVYLKIGDYQKVVGLANKAESLAEQLRISTNFHDTDYSTVYDFLKFNVKDLTETGLQNGVLSFTNNQVDFTTDGTNGPNLGTWTPLNYGASTQYGFNVINYNTVSNPIIYQCGRWILLPLTGISNGQQVVSISIPTNDFVGVESIDPILNVPRDIRFYQVPLLYCDSNNGYQIHTGFSNKATVPNLLSYTISKSGNNYNIILQVNVEITGSTVLMPLLALYGSQDYAEAPSYILNGGVPGSLAISTSFNTSSPIIVSVASQIYPKKNFVNSSVVTDFNWNNYGLFNSSDVFLYAIDRLNYYNFDGQYSVIQPPDFYVVNQEFDFLNYAPNSLDSVFYTNNAPPLNTGEIVFGKVYLNEQGTNYTTPQANANIQYSDVINVANLNTSIDIDFSNQKDNVEVANFTVQNLADNKFSLKVANTQSSNIASINEEHQFIIDNYKNTLPTFAMEPLYDFNLTKLLYYNVQSFSNSIINTNFFQVYQKVFLSFALNVLGTDFILSHIKDIKDNNSPASTLLNMLFKNLFSPSLYGESAYLNFNDAALRLYYDSILKNESTVFWDFEADQVSILNTSLPNDNAFEIYMPVYDNCETPTGAFAAQGLTFDYTLRMVFEYHNQIKLQKDLYIMASNYLLSDQEYDRRASVGQSLLGYYKMGTPLERLNLTPGTVGSIREFYLYGYAGLIPDLKPGISRPILTRVVSPPDPTQITEQEFIANLVAQGFSDTTDPSISDFIQAYLDSGNTFYTVDNNQYSSLYSSLNSTALCVSTYSTVNPPYWSTNLILPYFNNRNVDGDFTYTNDIWFDVQNVGKLNFSGTLQNVSVTPGSFVDSLTIINGGSGLQDGTYTFTLNAPIGVGLNFIAAYSPGTCSVVVSGGSIQSAIILTEGSGYTYDFIFYPMIASSMSLNEPQNKNQIFKSFSGPGFVQNAGGGIKASTSMTVNFTPTVIGNTLLVAVFFQSTTNSVSSISSLPSLGFTRLLSPYVDGANNITLEIWYANNISASINTLTVNFNTSTNATVHFSEFTGLSVTSLLDQSANTNSIVAGSSATSGPTATTTKTSEIWISYFGLMGDNGDTNVYGVDNTPSNGYTLAGDYKYSTGTLMFHTGHGVAMCYKIVSSTGVAGNTITVDGGSGDVVNTSISLALSANAQPTSTTSTTTSTTSTSTSSTSTSTSSTSTSTSSSSTSTSSTTTLPVSTSVTTAPISVPAIAVKLKNRDLVNIVVDATGAIINNSSFTIVEQASQGFAFDFLLDNNAIIYQSNRSFLNPALIIVRLHNYKVRCDSFSIAESGLAAGALELWGLQATASSNLSPFNNTITNFDYLMYTPQFAVYLVDPGDTTVGDIDLELMLSIKTGTTIDSSGFLRIDVYSDKQGVPGELLHSSDKVNYSDLTVNSYGIYKFHVNYNFTNYGQSIADSNNFSNNYWLILSQEGYLANGLIFIKSNTTDALNYYTVVWNGTSYPQSGNILFNASSASLVLSNNSEQLFDSQVIITNGLNSIINNDTITVALKKIDTIINGITDQNIQVSLELQYTNSFVTTTLQSSYITISNISKTFSSYSFTLSGFPSGIFNVPSGSTINYLKIKTSSDLVGGYLAIAKNGQSLNTAINAISDDTSTWLYDLVQPYIVFYQPNSTVYSTFNRDVSEINYVLPPKNSNREEQPLYYVEGWWNFTCNEFAQPISLSIYPRAFRTAVSLITQSNAQWNYAGYSKDIYVGIKYLSSGQVKDQIIKLSAYPAWQVRWWSQSALSYKVINEQQIPIVSEYDSTLFYYNANIMGINEFLNAVFIGVFTPFYQLDYNINIQFNNAANTSTTSSSTTTTVPSIVNTFGVKVYINDILVHDSWDYTETSAAVIFTVPYNVNSPSVSMRIEYYKGSATSDNINLAVYWKPTNSSVYQLMGPDSSAPVNNNEVVIDTNIDRILFMIVGKTYNELNQPFLGSPPNDRFLVRSQ